jgi:hypothetical protein
MIWDLAQYSPNFDLAYDHDLEARDGRRYRFTIGKDQIARFPVTPQSILDAMWTRTDGHAIDYQCWVDGPRDARPSGGGFIYLGFDPGDGLVRMLAYENPITDRWFSDEAYRVGTLKTSFPRYIDDEATYFNRFSSTIVTLRNWDFANPVSVEPAPDTYITIGPDRLPTGDRGLVLSGRTGDGEERWWFGSVPNGEIPASLNRGIRRFQHLTRGVVDSETYFDRWVRRLPQ